MGRRRWFHHTVAAAVLATALAGCTQDVERPATGALGGEGLVAAGSCDELVRATRGLLTRQLVAGITSATGVDGAGPDLAADGVGRASEGLAATGAESGQQVPPAGQVVADINRQEAEVAEGDLMATDGRRIVTVVDGVLRVSVLDGTPEVDGTVDLRAQRAGELLLRGDEAVVIGGEQVLAPVDFRGGALIESDVVEPIDSDVVESTTLTLVDLSDPADPRIVDTVAVQGRPVATRMVGSTVRIVLQSTPAYQTRLWQATDPAEATATVSDLTEADILPRVRLADGTIRPLGACEDVLTIPAPSGATSAPGGGAGGSDAGDAVVAPPSQQVTVLTLRDGLADLAPVTVQGGAEAVYATTGSLWITSTTWDDRGPLTAVHRFELPANGPAAHAASGTVPGVLLDRYSMSEHDGHLRIVTTVEDLGGPAPTEPGDAAVPEPGTDIAVPEPGSAVAPEPAPPAPPVATVPPVPPTAGRLAVLRPDGGTLTEVGHLDDLGVGERVRSVRFLDDVAYVVTFRQTDPLFAISVADPGAPRLLGELKIPGFSEYLHPVGDGLLLGIGREVDPETLEDRGLKVSLFDVSDPEAPAEAATWVLADTWSPVAQDPHAFSWDPTRRRAAFPVEGPDGGALLVVDTRGAGGAPELREVARLRHPGSVPVRRSVVVDRDLWTVSTAGLGRSDADVPDQPAMVPFRQP